ncbi:MULTISPECIES: alpha/beta hydrolase family protein [Paenibacillus]|uniref:alpha/beta hydrolase family protein n=1 Tax=Paenibacillus TaxID=44249 RepID=UPI0022B93AE9|nr:dienelactone hydrolase [Paenibacillus caseinilyticus]MCZ8521902.1 dienelactone hydrolase [Paenibacillus caseinilyticus]
MRSLEWLLLACGFASLYLAVAGPAAKSPSKNSLAALAAGSIGIAVLILHLAVEGWRWQLLLLYGLTLMMAARSLRRRLQVRAGESLPPPKRVLWIVPGVLLLLSGTLALLMPVFRLPEPTGPYKVGTRLLHFVDENRQETFGEGKGGKRELLVQVWYPAEGTEDRQVEPFVPEGHIMLDAMAANFKLPEFLLDYLRYIPSHSYAQSALASSEPSYPLLLLNHGFGTSRIYHTSQAEELASHGYIVAGIDHTYNTAATVFPDGRVARSNKLVQVNSPESRDKVGRVWTQDVTFTLDQFEKLNKGQIEQGFQGKIDLSRIGVFGHSFGGAASYDAAYDPRVKAGVDLDGTLYGFRAKPGVAKPFLLMYSASSFDAYNKTRVHYKYTEEELRAVGSTKQEWKEQMPQAEREMDQIQRIVRNGTAQVLYIEGTQHYNFTDAQLISPLLRWVKLTGEIGGQRSGEIVRRNLLEFFDKQLKQAGADQTQREKENAEYPEVKDGTSIFAQEVK